jgi:uncharacterized protein (TIGR02266 family)
MVQDTRKDPRAKVLTMTVRYKSATIDEFIEHHSHDVSRGGIFIKTPSPFPPGTLLKFEIRIAEDKAIIGGVGRVVWKRDASQSAGERPAGMGVKFLKIDETSRKVIDQIIDNKGDVPSAFEESDESAEAAPAAASPAAPAPSAEAAKPIKSKKATMLGLGAVGVPLDAEKEEDKPKEGGFFPKTDSEKEMPPPEERTVMKQAAELLAEALKGAGGSMEEIGAAPQEEPKKETVEAKPVAAADTTPIPSDEDEPLPKSKPEPEKKAEPKKAAAVAPLEDEEEDDEPPRRAKDSSPPPPRSEPKPKAAAVQAKDLPSAKEPEEAEGGSMRVLLGVAAVIGLLAAVGYFVVLPGLEEAPPTTPSAAVPTVPPPPTTYTVKVEEAAPPPVEAGPEASAEPAVTEEPPVAEPPKTVVPPPPKTTAPPPPPPPKTTAPPPPPPPKTTAPPPPPPPKTTAPPPPPPPKTATPKPPPDDNPY